MKRRPLAAVDDAALGRLLDAVAPDQLDLALLDLAWAAGLAPALAVWRHIGDEGSLASGWYPVRGRGPTELLPSSELIQATLENGLDERLPGNSFVLSSNVGHRSIALVLGSVRNDDVCDVASGLLGLHAVVAQSQGFDALDETPLPPAMPHREIGDEPECS